MKERKEREEEEQDGAHGGGEAERGEPPHEAPIGDGARDSVPPSVARRVGEIEARVVADVSSASHASPEKRFGRKRGSASAPSPAQDRSKRRAEDSDEECPWDETQDLLALGKQERDREMSAANQVSKSGVSRMRMKKGITMDTGAHHNVMPKQMVGKRRTRSSEDSRRGMRYVGPAERKS